MVDLRKLDPAMANQDHEKSRIRWVNLSDPEEKKRLWEIETDSLVAKYVEDLAETEDELIEFTTLEKDYLVLAVEGKSGHVEEAEVGKLQGWVTVYPEDKRRLVRLQKQGLIDLIKEDLRFLEIGFAKHPLAKSKQIASAIRQALGLLREAHKQDGGQALVITAYADEANEASTRVLLAAGFSLKGKVKYHLKNISHDNFFILFG
ncbi:GNAT family N-acetyltransferase [Candidatus Collierbacteria bacterium]|nr:GNAT family N-acetyltransferase [Candidatus Collierbacteria bacterium]